jgi:hypothetical protein
MENCIMRSDRSLKYTGPCIFLLNKDINTNWDFTCPLISVNISFKIEFKESTSTV